MSRSSLAVHGDSSSRTLRVCSGRDEDAAARSGAVFLAELGLLAALLRAVVCSGRVLAGADFFAVVFLAAAPVRVAPAARVLVAVFLAAPAEPLVFFAGAVFEVVLSAAAFVEADVEPVLAAAVLAPCAAVGAGVDFFAAGVFFAVFEAVAAALPAAAVFFAGVADVFGAAFAFCAAMDRPLESRCAQAERV
jgi:hypothetical protein